MDDKRIRPGVWLAVVGSLAVLAVVLVLLPSRRQPTAPAPDDSALPASSPAASPADRAERTRVAAHAAAQAPSTPEPPEYIDGLVYGELDLREAKALMPDNLYWKLGAPTKDADVLAEREAEEKRRNEEYGRVLAGDANEDEVRAYYDYRKKLSSDYLEFSEFMSRRFKNSDNQEFVGMLELAMKMHAQRLAQIPTDLQDALERSLEHEKAREDWKKQQEEFGASGGVPSDADDNE